ncbi:MAG TPA: hypothetical protein VMA37_06750 [Acetobacteraceae bacterium]|nr:hypothetical protein [Acetobacteraceae bacterium]
MSTLLKADRLNEFARATTRLAPPPERPIVRLQWTIDATTGRPIGRWVLQEKVCAASCRTEESV